MQTVRHLASPAAKGRFVLPLRVYYEDTDAAGVVYYANYLRFCERARTEWLRELGFEQQKLLAEQGLAFVVRSVRADYLSPALLDDALQVVSVIDTLGRASLTFGQQVLRGERVLFDAQVVIACVDWNKKRPAAMPADIHNKFHPFAKA